jgi:hypothetical protein
MPKNCGMEVYREPGSNVPRSVDIVTRGSGVAGFAFRPFDPQ